MNLAYRLTCIAGVAIVTALGVAPPTAAQTTAQRQPTFEERLILGLQVRRPSEFDFIDAVIDTIDRGELQKRAVERVFAYARARKRTGRADRRPIIAFQAALERIAKNLRIDIRADPRPTIAG